MHLVGIINKCLLTLVKTAKIGEDSEGKWANWGGFSAGRSWLSEVGTT